MDDQFLINTLVIMAGIESKQPGAMPFEDNPLFVAAERLKQLTGTASNEVLARRVVELTNERDAALAQLVEVQDNRTGKAPCERFCEALATKKMFDNLQRHNQQLKAQVEQLLKPAKEAAEALGFASHHLRGRASENMLMDMAEKADALISAIGSTPTQCLAEIKAQALEDEAQLWPDDLTECSHVKSSLLESANQLRQQVKGE